MSSATLINFDEPVPLFPLRSVVLYPQTLQPLHLFEPRYIQMIESIPRIPVDDEDRSRAVIAMAVIDGRPGAEEYVSEPPLRPVVCVGRVLKDETLPDGRHNILMLGICRARIRTLNEPEGDRLFRTARLRPIESMEALGPSPVVRNAMRRLLHGDRLSRMHASEAVRSLIERDDVPVETLVEMASFILMKDEDVRYRLLAEPDPSERARIVHSELERIDRLVSIGDRQAWRDWPRNLSWN